MQDNVQNQVVELYVDDIIPNRFQPREVFEDKALQELAISIKEHGVIQPIIVRKLGEKYEIIAGERRYKANIMAGFTKIPAIIRNLDDKETAKVALLENLQRKNLSPIEEARTYQKILDLDSMTQEELGKTMGKSQAAVANKLRLLQLSDEVQEALLNNQISERHARSLLGVSDKEKQVELLNKIINSRMTVRELDEELKTIYGINVGSEGVQPISDIAQNIHTSITQNEFDRNLTASSNINIDSLKEQAEDIIPETVQTNNLNQLLQGQEPPKEINPIESGPQFKFLDDFSNSSKKNNSLDETDPVVIPSQPIGENNPTVASPVETDDSRIQIVPGLFIDQDSLNENGSLKTDIPGLENPVSKKTIVTPSNIIDNQWSTPSGNEELPIPTNVISKREVIKFTIRDAINAIRELAKELEKNGVQIDLDEMDLENYYQINVKLNK